PDGRAVGAAAAGARAGGPLLPRERDARPALRRLRGARGGDGGAAEGRGRAAGRDVRPRRHLPHRGRRQQVLADALATPVAVGASAGEGGAWGMALLAAFTAQARQHGSDAAGADGAPSLPDFLAEQVFASQELSTIRPDRAGMDGHA